jgi:hypothetical protein
MGQAVRRKTLTAEARVRLQTTPCEIVVDTVAQGQMYLIVLLFFPVIIIPPMPSTHLSLNTPSSEGQADEAWEPSNDGIVCVFYITNEMQLIQCSLLLSALYMFRAVFPPVIRSL